MTHAIGVCCNGGGTLFTGGKGWVHSKGMIVVTNPFAPHWGRPSPQGLDYWLFYPDPRWLGALPALKDAPSAFWFETPIFNDPPLASQLSDAIETLTSRGDGQPLVDGVDALFARYAGPASAGRERFSLHSEATPEHPAAGSRMSIASRAARAGLSRAYYSRTHRKRTGLSPLHLRRQTRVLAAQVMIENGAALAEVAVETGFSDQAHMTRQFRQILGVTPATYRPTK